MFNKSLLLFGANVRGESVVFSVTGAAKPQKKSLFDDDDDDDLFGMPKPKKRNPLLHLEILDITGITSIAPFLLFYL